MVTLPAPARRARRYKILTLIRYRFILNDLEIFKCAVDSEVGV